MGSLRWWQTIYVQGWCPGRACISVAVPGGGGGRKYIIPAQSDQDVPCHSRQGKVYHCKKQWSEFFNNRRIYFSSCMFRIVKWGRTSGGQHRGRLSRAFFVQISGRGGASKSGVWYGLISLK